MKELLIFTLGVILGCIVMQLVQHFKMGHGYFRIAKHPEDEELYTINVRFDPKQQLTLTKVNRILLKREYSQK